MQYRPNVRDSFFGRIIMPFSSASFSALLVALFLVGQKESDAFTCSSSLLSSSSLSAASRQSTSSRLMGTFYNDFEGYNDELDNDDDDDDDDDEEEDEYLLVDDRNWRTFRKNLSLQEAGDRIPSTVSKENEEILESQSKELYSEYKQGIWAHETSTPEVGGLIVRLPLELELFRNYQHSLTGKRFRETLADNIHDTESWYHEAQNLIAEGMTEIAELAGDDGQIDATSLPDHLAELLNLYLDNQEAWQEVSLVLERDTDVGTATSLVLNRPMAFQLTENLARLVLHGEFSVVTPTANGRKPDLHKFMAAFGSECAVYIGGPDDQGKAAEIIHGIKTLPGAREIAPGTGIYRGGLTAAVDGVLRGLYQPLDFRFFVGKHIYDDNILDLSVILGKFQPVACSRALALKQCISLPKPLWHEVLEWAGGNLAQISELELSKRDDLKFKIVDEDDDDDFEGIVDELDELGRFDDDDDEDEDDDYYTK
mmetsp:Transcript_10668/g.21825  ORF Transcript_10668/g.21825 Transcript_10668/m.21825 type:complete len:483 (+) Transcript_10668:184-1632(+)